LGRDDAREFIGGLIPSCTAPLNFAVMRRAWMIQDEAGFSYWDCLLLASASLAGCGLFLTEDMQHERRVFDLQILDPFRIDQLNDLPI
jgi:predicted nucleic acid-binding protein